MRFKVISFFCLCITLFFTACSNSAPVLTFPDVTIGIAPIVQPSRTIELLAGNIPNPQEIADEEQIAEIQTYIDNKIGTLNRKISLLPAFSKENITVVRNSRRGALDLWADYANKHEVDLLIIPFLNYYSLNPNSLMLDFFILDLRNTPSLIDRYLFAEQQMLENSEEMHSSFTRREKKYSMEEMIEEAIENAFLDFNLN